jgi:uncharacterized membrane protein
VGLIQANISIYGNGLECFPVELHPCYMSREKNKQSIVVKNDDSMIHARRLFLSSRPGAV